LASYVGEINEKPNMPVSGEIPVSTGHFGFHSEISPKIKSMQDAIIF
jgi:hypothetical protein